LDEETKGLAYEQVGAGQKFIILPQYRILMDRLHILFIEKKKYGTLFSIKASIFEIKEGRPGIIINKDVRLCKSDWTFEKPDVLEMKHYPKIFDFLFK